MKKVYLFEDHDLSLEIWRKNRIKGLDLVHVDAHIDFSFHEAESIDDILDHARSVADLKKRLEYSQSYSHFEQDFSKQVDIGNYIYPAMREGIVKDFYWVVPGGHKEFIASKKVLIATLKQLIRIEGSKAKINCLEEDSITAQIFGRKLCVCSLESLPLQKKPVILDVDIDFLVIKSANAANNTAKIGKRKPWIFPQPLQESLRQRVLDPRIITIAYSCNGGYTPIKYRYLGDELAYLYDPQEFKLRYDRNLKAAQLFDQFISTGKKRYYRKAIRLNPLYRSSDNNYGLLYLLVNNYRKARKEFDKIQRVDQSNPGSLTGLGILALKKCEFRKAEKYFLTVLKSSGRVFAQEEKNSLLGLAEAEYGLKNFTKAEKLLLKYIKKQPLESRSRYLLARIYEQKKDLGLAAKHYIEAIRLGLDGLEAMYRLAKLSFRLKEKNSIIEYISAQLNRIEKYKNIRFSLKDIKRLSFIRNSVIGLEKGGGK